jgi:hypothetical protein
MARDDNSDTDQTPTRNDSGTVSLDRRSLVRGGLGVVVAGSLAGCQSLTGSSDGDQGDDEPDDEQAEETGTGTGDGGGDQSEPVVFEDDWADGDLDGWTAYVEGGDAAASVESMSTPSGGSQVLRLAQSTGSGTKLIFGTETAFSGWGQAWSIRTAVHTTALDPDVPYQGFDIVPAYDPAAGDDYTLSFRLGFRDGDSQVRPIEFVGDDVDESSTGTRDWVEGRWYEVELTHDGSGTLQSTVWPTTSSKPSTPTVEASASLPSSGSFPIAIHLNGSRRADFRFSHSFIRLSGDLEQSGSN